MNSPSDLERELQDIVRRSRSGRLQRAWGIITHYRWSQICRRVFRVVRERLQPQRVVGDWADAPTARLRAASEPHTQLARLTIDFRSDLRATAINDLQGGFVGLLGEAHNVGYPIRWAELSSSSALPHLARFHLHYHEFLLGELARRGDSCWELVWQTLASWLEAFPPTTTLRTSDAWHPYCISRRIPVWCWLLTLGEPPARLRDSLTSSLATQAHYLSRHRESELGGNHLLENVAALAIAAGMVEHPEANQWLATATRTWEGEKAEQILLHGEHFERSPMYHCQVVGNLLRQSIMVAEIDRRMADEWLETALRMLKFLEPILHPDGEIPLLGDSGWEEAPNVKELQALAELVQRNLNRSSTQSSQHPSSQETTSHDQLRVETVGPYWVARWGGGADESFVLVDGGEVGPQHLPAHAHADLTNLEISLAGKRWVVDSGNFQYAPGSMRDYCRASLAHNVMTVGGRNSCDVWGGFRMGRRGKIVAFQPLKHENGHAIRVAHDGYLQLGIKRIERVVGVESSGTVWVFDRAEGTCAEPLRGFLHFHPAVECSSVDDSGKVWNLSREGESRTITFIGASQVSLANGWVCSAFGVRERGAVLVYESPASNKLPIGWSLARSPNKSAADFPKWLMNNNGN